MKSKVEYFNSNIYSDILIELFNGFDEIRGFLNNIASTNQISELSELKYLFKKIFSQKIFEDQIFFSVKKIERLHDLGALFGGKPIRQNPVDGNSMHFINIQIVSDDLKFIDKIYSNRLTGLLRSYKNIFTVFDNPTHTIKSEVITRQESVLTEILKKKSSLITEQNNRLHIRHKKEKLNKEIISSLPFDGFYHMTHIDNVSGILKNGMLSFNTLKNNEFVNIANEEIRCKRDRIESIYDRSILDYVPLYINPRNPMMLSDNIRSEDNILLLEILPHILIHSKNTLFSMYQSQ